MNDELAARRAGKREANLRDLNERIADAQEEAGGGDQSLRLVCECALHDCTDGIDVECSVFDELRADQTRFIVCPGHVLHEVEREWQQGNGWMIVEKVGRAARAAKEELR